MLRKVDLLRHCGIRDVVLVFDGQRLPLKASTHDKRQELKQENRRLAVQLMADARRQPTEDDRQAQVAKAFQHFQRAVSITPEIVSNVMQGLRNANVRFVVAPFEADAQMVWMCREGLASAIVTEDSDVLVYCVAASVDCPVLFKLDDGGMVHALSRLSLHRKCKGSANTFLKRLEHLTTSDKQAARMFVQVCALSGCDFLDSLPNMGVVTALKHVFSFRGAPSHVRVQRLVSKLAASGTKIPSDFVSRFQQTECIFFHHIIFNEKTQQCEFLVEPSHPNCHDDVFARVRDALGITSETPDIPSLHELVAPRGAASFIGNVPDRDTMQAMYKGEICSRSRRPMQDGPAPHQQVAAINSAARTVEPEKEQPPSERHQRIRPPEAPVDPMAEARRQAMKTQQRDASLRSLLTSYSHSQHSTVESSHLITASTSAANTKTTDNGANVPASGGTDPPRVTSLKELASRHSRSADSENASPSVVPPKRRAPSFGAATPAKKARATQIGTVLSSSTTKEMKKTPARSGTLLHFFAKQSQ
ncbi:hypothetical protein PINS_up015477 [Pythium insidiosum]|nr:hypothetical protein PINS_up015477 [Pythium insidiosum]